MWIQKNVVLYFSMAESEATAITARPPMKDKIRAYGHGRAR
jgi:hypothetical protein